jgi:integrase
MAGSELVFSTTGKTCISGFSKAKRAIDAAIKIKSGRALAEWRIHDLRRTVATGLQRFGVNLQVTESILGHISGSRAGIVGVYQRHRFDAEKRTALAAWARHVEAITSGKPGKVIRLARS